MGLERMRHGQSLRRVLKTPPVAPGDGRVIVFSQVCARDVLMYLVAVKSFAQHTGLRDFAVLDDGSLTGDQRDVLRQHLPGVRITSIDEVRSSAVPSGGCWERLMLAARLGERAYVVQLDCDTLTLGRVDEVVECVSVGRAFSLTSEPAAAVLPIKLAAENAQRHPEHLLQFAAESRLDCLQPDVASHYVRGCAGFTGLPPAPRLELVEEVSRRMRAALKDRWSEWGTEQVTTNLLTANSPGLTLLRPPVYATHEGRGVSDSVRFVHFMGTHRFSGPLYRRLTERVIDALMVELTPESGQLRLSPSASAMETVV